MITQLFLILVGFLMLAGVLYVMWKPHWVFLLVIVMFPLEQLLQVSIPLFATVPQLFNFLVGGLVVIAIVLRFMKGDPMLSGVVNPMLFLVAMLYILRGAGMLYTPAPDVAQEYMRRGIPYIILLALLLPLLIRDVFEFRRMLIGVMVVGTVLAILIMVNPKSTYYSGRLTLDVGMIGGGITDRGNPLAIAEMGGLLALIAALIRPTRPSGLFTALRIAAFFAGLGLAIGSGSRGQVLAAVVAGIIAYPFARKVANPKQFFFGALGFGILILGISSTFRIFIGQQNIERWDPFMMVRDIALRFDLVWDLFSAYLASPTHWLFGLGTNAFAAIHEGQILYVHNVAAEVLCENGLVGGVLFLLMLILTIRYGVRLWNVYRDDVSMRSTTALLLAICAYYLFLSLKQGSIHFPTPFYWWLVMAKLWMYEQQAMAAGADIALAADDVPEDADPEPWLDDRGYAVT